MMTKTEIKNTGTTTLQLRLAIVEYSTLPAYAAETEMIRDELHWRAISPKDRPMFASDRANCRAAWK